MAETVTWPLLRELANFRAEKGCAVSLYLNLDPSEVPTAGDAQSRMNALLNEAEKKDRKDLTHEQRRGVLADFERIARWFDDEFDRAGSRALAVFAAGLDNYWSPMQLVQPVPDIVKVGRDFYLAPLAPAVARADGTIIAVVGREQGQLFRLRAGRLEEIAEHFDEQPGRHDQGGWSQARYQRHIEKLVQDHLKGAAEVARKSDRAARSGYACSRKGAGEGRGRSDRPLARGGRSQRSRRVRVGADARSRLGRSRRPPALPGRIGPAGLALPGLRSRCDLSRQLPTRRDASGAGGRRSRPRGSSDTCPRRRCLGDPSSPRPSPGRGHRRTAQVLTGISLRGRLRCEPGETLCTPFGRGETRAASSRDVTPFTGRISRAHGARAES